MYEVSLICQLATRGEPEIKFRFAHSSAADEGGVNLLHIFPNYSRSLRAILVTIRPNPGTLARAE
jgi:hypothetical protein